MAKSKKPGNAYSTTDIIETQRLGLRKWLESDIKSFVEMNQDADVMKYFPKMLTEQEALEMVERIRSYLEKNNHGLYAVELKSTSDFLGYTGFAVPTFESFFTPCIEIGWRFKKEFWGRALQQKLLLLVCTMVSKPYNRPNCFLYSSSKCKFGKSDAKDWDEVYRHISTSENSP